MILYDCNLKCLSYVYMGKINNLFKLMSLSVAKKLPELTLTIFGSCGIRLYIAFLANDSLCIRYFNIP